MRKRNCRISILIMTTCMLTGCGTAPEEAAEYVQLQGLGAVTFAEYREEQDDEIVAAEESGNVWVEAEADGTEELSDRMVLKSTDVYNKPSSDAAVLGSVSRGEIISVVGLLEDEKWYKVEYNGRVAYVSANAIESETEDTLVQENTDQVINRTDNANNDSVSGTDDYSSEIGTANVGSNHSDNNFANNSNSFNNGNGENSPNEVNSSNNESGLNEGSNSNGESDSDVGENSSDNNGNAGDDNNSGGSVSDNDAGFIR